MRNGFTLIEILVILAISALLSAIAITYTSVGRSEVALTVASSQIAQVILRAKELSLATYHQALGTCGYGVYFDVAKNSYSLFVFTPQAADHPAVYAQIPPCPSVASTTAAGIAIAGSPAEIASSSSGTWKVSLGPQVKLQDGGNGDTLAVVMFYPPDPAIFMTRYPASSTFLSSPATSKVYLVTADGAASTTVSVNAAGGVTF